MTQEQIIPSINYVNDCLSLLKEKDYEGYRDKLYELAANKIVKAKDPECEKLRTQIHKMIDDLLQISYPSEVFIKNSSLHSEIATSLIHLSQLSYENFMALKKKNSCLDFTDMERYALMILKKDDNAIAKKISAFIEEVLVDEFQDTSLLQDEIIRLFAGSKCIFRVGDVKQSIYRFRQAKPQLMRDLIKDPNNTTFHLRYNYRSNEQIINFTNVLFERIMNERITINHYGDHDRVSAGSARQKSNGDARAELVLLETNNNERTKDGRPKAMKAGQAKYVKASWIAQKIITMMDEDPSLNYADFAVLTRSHDDQLALKTHFDRYHIP